jgi:hypothetical protein
MAISGFTPITALPGTMPGAMAAQPGAFGAQLHGIPLTGASYGVQERPGIGARLLNAMRSAVGELRGSSATALPAQTLAMQSTAPVTVQRPAAAGGAAKFPNAKTWKDKAGNVREVGTGKILKPAPGAAAAPGRTVQQPMVGPQGAVGPQLPANATQVPGATVYSYDQHGNPMAPTMQQLGMTPTMLQGFEHLAGAADPSGPQLNATNQTNVGLGAGMGMGMGSAVPMLGQPIVTAPPSPAGAGASTGGTQSVTNENVVDANSHNQGPGYGFGSGWGLPFGGVATPAAPYGSSMFGRARRLF